MRVGMRVGILGPLRVTADGGEPVPVGGARLRALLARLGLDAGRVVTVDALAAALWPDDEVAGPAHAVQSLVARLRRALPERSVVRAEPGGYRLDLPADAVDALRFERLATAGSEDEPPWLYRLDQSELAATTGRCLAVLGRPLRAVRMLTSRTTGGPRGDRARSARSGPTRAPAGS